MKKISIVLLFAAITLASCGGAAKTENVEATKVVAVDTTVKAVTVTVSNTGSTGTSGAVTVTVAPTATPAVPVKK